MCGIAGIHILDTSVRVNTDAALSTMLNEIDSRGGDACGHVALGAEGVLEWQRAAVDAADFNKHRRGVPKGTRTILAHTRWATQGLPGFMENNHPIKRGPFYVIHNGHVSNDWDMFKLAERVSFAQVDSEAIAALLAWHDKLEKVPAVMEEIEGAAAIAAVDERNPLDLVLARGYSSPLVVLRTSKLVVWASTEYAVRQVWKKHVGKLPRRTKPVHVDEGRALMWIGGEFSVQKFTPYSPPTYSFQGKDKGWLEKAMDDGDSCQVEPTRHLPTIGGWPKWDKRNDEDPTWNPDDTLDGYTVKCDECNLRCSWDDITRVPEPGTDFEWMLCHGCSEDWDAALEDELRDANKASLAQIGAEERLERAADELLKQ